MSLQKELSQLEASRRAERDASRTAIMDAATAALEVSQLANRIVGVGETAPDFSLPNARGEQVQLSSYLQEGPVVLSFYRGGWCPYCNLELRALQEVLPEIKAFGGQLLAISPDAPDGSLSTTETNALAFEVLSDEGNHIAKAYRLVFQLPAELRELSSVDRAELPLPASYVIAPNAEIVYAFAQADYTKRAEPAELLEALKGIAVKV